MRVSARSIFSCFALASLLTLSACGGGGSGGSSTVNSITIAPAGTASAPNLVAINSQSDFTATVTLANPNDITTTTVTWLVNGVAGGSSETGTVVSSGTNNEVGIYTGPTTVPITNNGVVQITATTPKNPADTSDTTVVTSNTAYVQVTAGVGLVVSPTGSTVSAGSQKQFTATLNGIADNNVTWSVTPITGANAGSIDSLSGIYTAPPFPPPNGVVTIVATAQVGNGMTTTASATAIVIYSDATLQGPYAFSYSGNDSGGFYSVAGSFVTNGQGTITNGVQDMTRVGSGGQVSTQLPITGGNYVVGADGRGQALLTTSANTTGSSFRFALTTNQHAFLTAFNNSATGSGTLDQQNADDLNASVLSKIIGPYVFSFSGESAAFLPRSIAGRFIASGSGGISNPGSILDDNNNGTVHASDTSLGGSLTIDPIYATSGRGTLTLTSTSIGTLQFAFYIVDQTHLHLVEIDKAAYLGGDVYQGASGSSFTTSLLASNPYSFIAGGNSSQGPYAVGGVFASNGTGGVSNGAVDINNNGTATLAASVSSCSYTVDPSTGRIDLIVSTASGSCTSGSQGVFEFSLYASASGPWLLLELDSAAISTGVLYPQSGSVASFAGNFAMGLEGQGAFNNTPSSFQPSTSGQMEMGGTSITTGNFDISAFSALFQNDPVDTTNSSLTSPTSNGRATGVIKLTNPVSTYTLSLYFVSANSALLLDQDAHRVSIGILTNQY
ncbi:MAG TPA: hypothetical protein VMU43_06905 [Candidatus Acidoferrum sp.]|nr:hypothetical protein [Candidatus Acidoferrum sp.]